MAFKIVFVSICQMALSLLIYFHSPDGDKASYNYLFSSWHTSLNDFDSRDGAICTHLYEQATCSHYLFFSSLGSKDPDG